MKELDVQLVVVRHGKAGERSDWAKISSDDELRPLTEKGVKEFGEVARHLHKIFPQLDLILSSSLVRAKQTAEILAKEYEKSFDVIDTLYPSSLRADVDKTLKRVIELSSLSKIAIAIVGHEPTLGEWVGEWIGSTVPLIFKKGGLMVLHFQSFPSAGTGRLSFASDPKYLK